MNFNYSEVLTRAAYLPILLTARGILTAFIGSTWTLTYARLTGSKESSPAPIPTNA